LRDLTFNLHHKSDGEGATGKAVEVEGAWRRQGARCRRGAGGKAHAEGAALALGGAGRRLKSVLQALGCGKAQVEVGAVAARRTWRSAHMD
jgi:hypothetical protein